MPVTEEKPGVMSAATIFKLDRDAAVKSLTGRVVRILWSLKPTGVPHLGLYLPIRDLALFSKHSGFHVGACVCTYHLLELITRNCTYQFDNR